MALLDEDADGDLIRRDEAHVLELLAVETVGRRGDGDLRSGEDGVELGPRRGDGVVRFVEHDEAGRLVLGGDMVEVGGEDGEGFAHDAGAGHRRRSLLDEFLAVGDEEALAGRTDLPATHDLRGDDGLACAGRGDDERVDALGQVREGRRDGGFLIIS